MRSRAVALAVTAIVLAGCTGTEVPGGPVPPEEPEDTAQQTPPPSAAQEHDDDRVPDAVADAATRAEADEADVEVIHLHEVTWPDGSIGCPEEGMGYTQALVEGYHLLLDVDGESFSYHAAGEEDFVYCADPQEPLRDAS